MMKNGSGKGQRVVVFQNVAIQFLFTSPAVHGSENESPAIYATTGFIPVER